MTDGKLDDDEKKKFNSALSLHRAVGELYGLSKQDTTTLIQTALLIEIRDNSECVYERLGNVQDDINSRSS